MGCRGGASWVGVASVEWVIAHPAVKHRLGGATSSALWVDVIPQHCSHSDSVLYASVGWFGAWICSRGLRLGSLSPTDNDGLAWLRPDVKDRLEWNVHQLDATTGLAQHPYF
ncbi:hypothetical protein BHM03_00052413 [Ensete ventricosum]|nr:hypothetical protein BHM03_00052413 [Ensete ventricosum]